MPKYLVYVERMVPQYRTVVVDAATYAEVEDPENQQKIFDAACQLDSWEYDDDCPRSQKFSSVCVVEPSDDEEDIRL